MLSVTCHMLSGLLLVESKRECHFDPKCISLLVAVPQRSCHFAFPWNSLVPSGLSLWADVRQPIFKKLESQKQGQRAETDNYN